MDDQAVLMIGAIAVPVVQFLKWAGLDAKIGAFVPPLVVVVVSLALSLAYAYDTPEPETIFGFITTVVTVATVAAGIFGFTRSAGEQITDIRSK